MRCTICGKDFAKRIKICPYCGAKLTGIVNAIEMHTAKVYVEEKFHGERGHGFAAERANDLYDKITGKDAYIVGDDNAKNGADRIVNGANIQSKYCSTGSKCVQECFENGKFRYYNPDGSPMQIEVPADKYNDAVKAMQNRIERGEIRGVKNAEDVIRKGNVTYEQAKNIAKAGTIESLTYDAVSGIRIGAYSGGISAAITFAVSMWNGKSVDEALKESVKTGLQIGGIAWASSILVGQMMKAGLNSALVPASDAVIRMLGPHASAHLVNAFRSGANIYGAAAMSSASKLLRGNIVTGIATAGAAVGSVVPIVGTAVGGVIGGFIGAFAGGTAAGKVSQTITDKFIEDDSKKMFEILQGEFQNVSFDFLLNKTETEILADKLSKKLDGSTLKDMYAADNRQQFAYDLIGNIAESVVQYRPRILLPTTNQYIGGLKKVLD